MPTPACIDLRGRFGRRYRVGYDESYAAERGANARIHDPWLMIIPCRFGHILPHGGSTLAVSVDGFPKIAGRLKRLGCCRVHQDGDFGELTVLFDVADFAKVARIMRPRRRRQVSPQERERLKAIGFKKGSQVHVETQYSDHTCVLEGHVESEHLPQHQALSDGSDGDLSRNRQETPSPTVSPMDVVQPTVSPAGGRFRPVERRDWSHAAPPSHEFGGMLDRSCQRVRRDG